MRPFACLALAVLLPTPGHAASFSVLYNFTGKADGATPAGTLIRDTAGNLYGTTERGGIAGRGTVFELTTSNRLTTLHTFGNGAAFDGAYPISGLTFDAQGNYWGTTQYDTDGSNGTIFVVTPRGAEAVRHMFGGLNDGIQPEAGLAIDSKGNFFGVTIDGGTAGRGTVFEYSATGKETVLHSFGTGSDGITPVGGVMLGAADIVYGTTSGGGIGGEGTVFQFGPHGAETAMLSFSGSATGTAPYGALVRDAHGNFYGTTYGSGATGYGTVFELSAAGAETILHNFVSGDDGAAPLAGVTFDGAGNIYGTTSAGGSGNNGTVFELPAAGGEVILHAFTGGTDGGEPVAGLKIDGRGQLFGVAETGGTFGNGVVFVITP